jgi:sulfide:quinone oxidoreductase
MNAPAILRGRSSHHRILIIGGGTAGITVAARLRIAGEDDIAIIEPSETHYYQPFWTLVGAGIVDAGASVRPERSVIPAGTRWIRGRARDIDPETCAVTLDDGDIIGYDFLIVAPGIKLDWDAVPGLSDALRTDSVASVYDFRQAPRMAGIIDAFRGGRAVFTNPVGPLKCGGAPMKIMFLAADTWRRKGILDDASIIYGASGTCVFAVDVFARVLDRVVERYGIDVHLYRELVEVRPERKEAVFRPKDETNAPVEVIPYDILHVSPPQTAPDFLKGGPLATDPKGWVDVDRGTLQSVHYANIFSLGDASSTPNAKTGAAVRKQAPVLVENLRSVMQGREPVARYDGYSSCPILTARDRMLLAEFDYDNRPSPSIPFLNTARERYSMYLLKRYGLPVLYWHGMLKGRA